MISLKQRSELLKQGYDGVQIGRLSFYINELDRLDSQIAKVRRGQWIPQMNYKQPRQILNQLESERANIQRQYDATKKRFDSINNNKQSK